MSYLSGEGNPVRAAAEGIANMAMELEPLASLPAGWERDKFREEFMRRVESVLDRVWPDDDLGVGE